MASHHSAVVPLTSWWASNQRTISLQTTIDQHCATVIKKFLWTIKVPAIRKSSIGAVLNPASAELVKTWSLTLSTEVRKMLRYSGGTFHCWKTFLRPQTRNILDGSFESTTTSRKTEIRTHTKHCAQFTAKIVTLTCAVSLLWPPTLSTTRFLLSLTYYVD